MEQAHTPSLAGLARDAAAVAGSVLAGASRQLTRARRSTKPLHPTGEVVTGVLTRTGSSGCGVPWLESPGTDEVLVRLSRAVGLPRLVPDIYGLALRVPAVGGQGDLLLASTGLGRLTRFVLTVGRDVTARPLTTLLPYRSPHGPLLVAARPVPGDEVVESGPLRFELLWALRTGAWVPFAELTVSSTSGPDPEISFDPVVNPLPALAFYPWVRVLRAPAYRAARRASNRS